MNSINGNVINSYTYTNANNTTNSVQSTENDTSSSNTNTENTATTGDTIEISTDCSSNSSFIKTLREVSSETETIPCAGGYMTADVALFNIREAMKDAGYNVPSADSNCSSYSDFIDQMKDFISSNSDISSSSPIIDFCDNLQERLKMYGIN